MRAVLCRMSCLCLATRSQPTNSCPKSHCSNSSTLPRGLGSARAGLLLHTGTTTEWIAPDVLAAPWWQVL